MLLTSNAHAAQWRFSVRAGCRRKCSPGTLPVSPRAFAGSSSSPASLGMEINAAPADLRRGGREFFGAALPCAERPLLSPGPTRGSAAESVSRGDVSATQPRALPDEFGACVRTGLSNSSVISNCNLEEFSARSPRVIIPRCTTGSHSEASESATETSNVAPRSKTTSVKS